MMGDPVMQEYGHFGSHGNSSIFDVEQPIHQLSLQVFVQGGVRTQLWVMGFLHPSFFAFKMLDSIIRQVLDELNR
jgi:hypothetical protein